MLENRYEPKDIESRLYEAWETSGAFAAGRRKDAATYCIVIPPPNVTGNLHMGHALNNTLQDILVRFERMRGKDVLWMPGTDHAGIATQLVVERQLAEKGNLSRRELGREEFVRRIWQWKAESGGAIVRQLRRLGASCDWSRERFTMDEGLSRAVLKVFVHLYKEGLIYKDKRLVNWEPRLQTAVSDLEVESIEIKGHLWHIKYPIEGESDRFVTVATTRPETMLGDVAVAVHPSDERWKPFLGRVVRLPLAGRPIPIIADEYADPEKGSGAVKITPGHDFNDFEVGKRHNLPIISIMDREARLNENVPAAYRGLDRFVARKKIVADLEALGLIEKVEEIRHAVPHDEKSKSIILEPMLTEQWYCNAEKLAGPAIRAVEEGLTKFVPENWVNTYYHWMRNIQPWCISRQLWWGHQIPAWYAPDGKIFVEETEEAAKRAAREHYGIETPLRRDEDVLDTWFSSALWPFSTLGWPENTNDLERFYKTDVLVTGFDIIFFWVARMMMMGLHFMKEVPFHTVYIHALVRDEKGAKMSKTKGNVIDPIDLVDEFGADALRFTLTAMAAQGRDIKLAKSRIEGYRNFATKIWNAARFAEMNEAGPDPAFDPSTVKETVNRWIISETVRAEQAIRTAIGAYKFNEAAAAAYQFTWGILCDWYLEFVKPLLMGTDESAKRETRATLAWVIDQVLHLLHPFMPFITEELWQRIGEGAGGRPSLLILSRWPDYGEALIAEAAAAEMNAIVDLITAIRSVRAEMRVPAGAQLDLFVHRGNAETVSRLKRHEGLIKRLARVTSIAEATVPPANALQIIQGEATYYLPVGGVIEIAGERTRLAKEIEKAKAEIGKIDAKLGNADFVAKAPEEVIEEQRERRAEAESLIERLGAALKSFSGAG